MRERKETNVRKILNFLGETFELLPAPFETPHSYLKRVNKAPYKYYRDSVRSMKKRGLVKIFEKNGKKFIQLTYKGQLESLLYSLRLQTKERWDGKWRMVIFDIPESSRGRRGMIRRLLKREGFVRLQNSVYISPFKLNAQSIDYLKKSYLIHYLRILRVDAMDDDKDLKNRFKLN